MLEKLNWFCLTGLIIMVVKMNWSVLQEKLYFKMLGLTSSSKLNWGSIFIYLTKDTSKKIGTLICSMRFLFHEAALGLYKSTITCMDYCCHV